jgi:type IV pilus assembly protein PilY1
MHPKKLLLAAALAPVLFLAPLTSQGEDIDIYTGDTTGGESNVLLVLDNSTNWGGTMNSNPPQEAIDTCGSGDAGTFFCAQKVALIRLLKARDPDDPSEYLIRPTLGVGLMLYTEKSTGNPGSIVGGYLRFGVRKMDGEASGPIGSELLTGNRGALVRLLRSLDLRGDVGSNSQENYAILMWEAFKYYGGGKGTSPISNVAWGPIPYAGVLGNGTDKRDFASNNKAGSANWASATGVAALTDGTTSARYNSPISNACGRNYIVFTSTSASQDSDNQNNSPPVSLFGAVKSSLLRVTNSSGTEITGSFADEAARYLFNSDASSLDDLQNIITYTIAQYNADLNDNTNKGNRDKMFTQMKSMAAQGGGSFSSASSVDLLFQAFSDVVTAIQKANGVFASPSLPLSANTQGTYLNQVFVGMFRSDPTNSPKWLGNLKQYQLKYDAVTNTARLADSGNPPLDAVDPATGFISGVATSFWTSSSTFWTNWVPGKTTLASDSPDGSEIYKGGAAQRLRENNLTSQASRNIYTCPIDSVTGAPNCAAGSLSLTPFNATTLNPSNAGTLLAFNYPAAWQTATSATADITNLIDWTRGTDNLNNELGPGGGTTVRPTIHGDVLHSVPVALNYAGRVVVFYGSNDGVLRAVEGKQTGTGAGRELWSFVAPESLSKLQRLRQESPKLSLPSSVGSPNNKSYFFDGSIGAYQEGGTAMIYVSMRRGGNFIYAFDVSNADDPKFKFKLSQASTGMASLGETWSVPKVMKVRDGTAGGKVVLIFGAGYDPSEDSDTAGLSGRGIYVVDGLYGVDGSHPLLKFFHDATDTAQGSITASVPSQVTIVDSDRDGFVDRAYVGDMAGNVWRMDLDDGSSTNPSSNWALYKLASLGPRKFFYPPDVVLGKDFTSVLIGSGDREKPLDNSTSDAFYMIKDAKTGRSGAGQPTIVAADLVVNTADATTAKGWYYNLNTAGEKVVNAPLTIGGVVYFGTNMPTNDPLSCKGSTGRARSYAMNFLTGAGTRPVTGDNPLDDAYSIVLTGGGLPPSPVAGLVDFGSPNGVVPICLGCGDRRSGLEAGVPDIDPSPVRRKTYWKFKSDAGVSALKAG